MDFTCLRRIGSRAGRGEGVRGPKLIVRSVVVENLLILVGVRNFAEGRQHDACWLGTRGAERADLNNSGQRWLIENSNSQDVEVALVERPRLYLDEIVGDALAGAPTRPSCATPAPKARSRATRRSRRELLLPRNEGLESPQYSCRFSALARISCSWSGSTGLTK